MLQFFCLVVRGVKKIIWDLAGTLLSADFSGEKKLFSKYFKDEELTSFLKNMGNYLDAYEDKYFQYDINSLAIF